MNHTLTRITLLHFFPLIVCAQETTGRKEDKINDFKNQPTAFADRIVTDTATNFKLKMLRCGFQTPKVHDGKRNLE